MEGKHSGPDLTVLDGEFNSSPLSLRETLFGRGILGDVLAGSGSTIECVHLFGSI